MDILKELGIIFGILFAGEFINGFFGLVLPGNVIGMMLLFVLLLSGVVKLNQVEKVSNFLLSNLTIFFLPAGVGIMKYYNLLEGKILAFLAVMVITTVLVMVFTGYVVQFSQRMVKNDNVNK